GRTSRAATWGSWPPKCAVRPSPRPPEPRCRSTAATRGSSEAYDGCPVPGVAQPPAFETLRWRDGRLELLDQRALPSRVAYLPYDSARAVAEGIRDMVVRGAPAIGCAAAY